MTSTEMSKNRLRNNLIACIHAGLLYRNPHGVSDEMLAAAVEEYDRQYDNRILRDGSPGAHAIGCLQDGPASTCDYCKGGE